MEVFPNHILVNDFQETGLVRPVTILQLHFAIFHMSPVLCSLIVNDLGEKTILKFKDIYFISIEIHVLTPYKSLSVLERRGEPIGQ